MTHDHHDREVVVDRGGDGSGVGMIIGIILAVIVVLAVIWFFFMGGLDGTPAEQTQPDQQIEIQAPDLPEPGDGDGGGDGGGD
jgi:hypothetical protein